MADPSLALTYHFESEYALYVGGGADLEPPEAVEDRLLGQEGDPGAPEERVGYKHTVVVMNVGTLYLTQIDLSVHFAPPEDPSSTIGVPSVCFKPNGRQDECQGDYAFVSGRHFRMTIERLEPDDGCVLEFWSTERVPMSFEVRSAQTEIRQTQTNS